ncbi:MAG: N-acetyltransferase [Sphingobacteriales bacterium]|jgi:predicted GNAT family acetyltransferase|nr:N-acetyltransferase [Sphingobacteriales bacterium]
MKPAFENIPLVRNESANQFEMKIDNQLAFINYEVQHDNTISLMHTEVAPALAGTGAAAALVEKTLIYLEKEGWLMQPYCP